ncbi:protoporphyrinogen oxidase [Ruficoccus amylovorans]|uniref:Coproporphyrinogen III oxidase n=2 Tax=Ruficoccus amylovorans TaxID=1804625 RepID=A0A842HCZ1_9BACT|nr:protoporphyrinogen oxidase [Ruficoccus amylovorans]MBC2594110.1 protoporphyrinogen oxidase [Ruficoccus amylovorans]
MKSAVVIGAGVTGLAAATTLKKAGYEVVLLEKHDRTGGCIHTVHQDGYLVETGPNSMMVNNLQAAMLMGEIGLADELLLPSDLSKNRYIFKEGDMVTVPGGPMKFMKSALLSGGGKLRLLKEPFIKKPDNLAEESLANFILRRLGKEVLDFVAEPLVSGIFAGDPKRLSAKHAFPQVTELEQQHGSLLRGAIKGAKAKPPGSFKAVMATFRNGMQSLTDKLAAQLGDSLVLNATVKEISHRGRWQVSWEANGEIRTTEANTVVIAVPAYVVRDLPLPRDVLDTLFDLHEIPYPPLTSISVGYRREQIQHSLEGFGVLVPGVEERKVLGVLFPSSVYAGRAPEGHVLLTVFIGGMRQPALATLDEQEHLDLVKSELKAILGATGDPAFVHRTLWRKAIPQYNVGHGDFLAMIEKAEGDHPGLHLAGNYRSGISVGQCLANGIELAKKIASA